MADPVLRIDGLGKGAVALDGPWQFHLGDNHAWALPQTPDATGLDGWEQLSADTTWGAQSHPNTEGFAWYRIHLSIAAAAPGTVALLVPLVDDSYQVYWNGRLIGSLGSVPPQEDLFQRPEPRSFVLGSPEPGVLAVRVWKDGFGSFDSGKEGGFESAPLLGSPQAIAAELGAWKYDWLRGKQLSFALNSLFSLVAIICFIAWLRDRRQRLVLWMAGYAIAHALVPIISAQVLPFSTSFSGALGSPFFCMGDISLWYLLAWLLDLRSDLRLMRLMRILATVDLTAGVLDVFTSIGVGLPHPAAWQWADAVLTAPTITFEIIPLSLILLALVRRKRLDRTRWLAALVAFMTQMIFVSFYVFQQGSRFTHWTLGDEIVAPLFTVWGSPVNATDISGTLLLIVLAYAVYRYAAENTRRQLAMEQEWQSARAVQQVLVPAEVPAVPGFAIESVYKPAGEVGGDFFQILPVEAGGALVVIGDVSGKGLPAAMTVSLLVGTVRTLAHYTQSPGEILAAMNQRMLARTSGGFTTCFVMRIDADGTLTFANAGHLAPYLRGKELEVEGGFPLGLAADSIYNEATFRLENDDQLTMVTDGVVEARDAKGELLGFERMVALSAKAAVEIANAAQRWGQEDDITVLAITPTAKMEAVTV